MSDYKTIYYYSNDFDETCYYEIIEYPNNKKKRYRTSVSLDNSEYQYVTYFNDLFEAIIFTINHQFKTQVYL